MYIKVLLKTKPYKEAIESTLVLIISVIFCIYFLDSSLTIKKYIIGGLSIFFIANIIRLGIFNLKKIRRLREIIKEIGSSFKEEYYKNIQINEIIFLNDTVILLEKNDFILIKYEDIKLIFIQSTLGRRQYVKNNLVVMDKDKKYHYVKIDKEDEHKILKTFNKYCPDIFVGYNKDLEESLLKDEDTSNFSKEHKNKKFEIDTSNDSAYYETIPIYRIYKKIIGRKIYYNLYYFALLFVIMFVTIDGLVFKNKSSLKITAVIYALLIEWAVIILFILPFASIYYVFKLFKKSKLKNKKYPFLKRLKNRKFFIEREYKDFYNIFIGEKTIIFFTKDLKEYLLIDKEIIWVYMTTISRKFFILFRHFERKYNGLVIVDRDNNKYEIIIEKEEYYTNNILKEIEKNFENVYIGYDKRLESLINSNPKNIYDFDKNLLDKFNKKPQED